jgi:hypothetical protein
MKKVVQAEAKLWQKLVESDSNDQKLKLRMDIDKLKENASVLDQRLKKLLKEH